MLNNSAKLPPPSVVKICSLKNNKVKPNDFYLDSYRSIYLLQKQEFYMNFKCHENFLQVDGLHSFEYGSTGRIVKVSQKFTTI